MAACVRQSKSHNRPTADLRHSAGPVVQRSGRLRNLPKNHRKAINQSGLDRWLDNYWAAFAREADVQFPLCRKQRRPCLADSCLRSGFATFKFNRLRGL